MNSTQAKSILITDLLYKLNHEPIKTSNYELWYLSPLHEEDTPSFKIDINKNVWYDHGIGKGGNIIDFVMILFSCSFSEALKKISSIVNYGDGVPFSFHQQKRTPKSHKTLAAQSQMTIKKVQSLQNPALINYITNTRCIDIKIAQKYLLEIYWINPNTNKSNFGLAFKNNTDGYEVRNSLLKLNIGGKDITLIKGKDNTKVSVFEGFMDFLSALVFFKIDEFKGDIFILNSLSSLERSLETINKYKIIYSFLDNDEAGKVALMKLRARCQGVQDCSNYYEKSKDFNAELIKQKGIK